MIKRLISASIALLLITTAHAAPGDAYRDSCKVALQPISCGKYGRGSDEWQRDHDDWCDGKRDDLSSDDLDDVDGRGYEDSRDAGMGR